MSIGARWLFPLPSGEGQGEGDRGTVRPNVINMPRASITVARLLRKRDTWAERLIWTWLRDRRFSAYKFRRQHPFGPYILDFFCIEAFLNIELDGSQHGDPTHREDDEERDAWLEKAGVRVLRFWNSRLRREREASRNKIWETLQQRAPRPVPDYCRPMVADASKHQRKTDA